MSTPVEEIKERLNIIDVINEYVQLKNMGANHKGLCPFHNEKTPSFTASESKQFFHCFGCGKGGDVFTFVQEVEGIEFAEALRILAQKAGIELRKVSKQQQNHRSRLLDCIAAAARIYHEQLVNAPAAEVARVYLQQRGTAKESSEQFQIGYAPDEWQFLTDALKGQGFTLQEIEQAGLALPSKNGRGYYDRFRGRLMFPLHNVHGNVVGFTGRTLKEDEQGGKYVNTPQTDLYNKSAVLYGLHEAKPFIRKMDAAVIVEGQMDVVSAHQAKFRNVVAASGTALTSEQVQLLKRFSSNVIFAFDADAAGIKAAIRGMQIAIREGMNIKIIPMPPGKDPDDLIQESPEAFREVAMQSVPLMEFIIDYTLAQLDLSNVMHKKQATDTLLPLIAQFPDAIEQQHYRQLLSKALGVPATVLQDKMSEIEKAQQQQRNPARARQLEQESSTPPAQAKPPSRIRQLGERLFALLSVAPQQAPYIFEHLIEAGILDEELKALYKEMEIEYNQRGSIDRSQLASSNERLRQKWNELQLIADELYASFSPQQQEQELLTVLESINRFALKTRLVTLQQELADAEAQGNSEAVQALSNEWTQLTEQLKKLG